MTREQALSAFRRVTDWEKRAFERVRQEILLPFFGGNLCRMHNCRINFEQGFQEYPVGGKTHSELARLAREFEFRQCRIRDQTKRLSDAFARFF